VYCGCGSCGGGLGGCTSGGVWGVAVAVAKAAEVEVATVVGAEVTGWDAVVPARTTEFLAKGLFTMVCSCC